jgi:hypothetical protein
MNRKDHAFPENRVPKDPQRQEPAKTGTRKDHCRMPPRSLYHAAAGKEL